MPLWAFQPAAGPPHARRQGRPEAPYVPIPTVAKLLRQIGAGVFVPSGAVRHDRLVSRNPEKKLVQFVCRQANGFRQLHIGFCPCLRIARVDDNEVFT